MDMVNGCNEHAVCVCLCDCSAELGMDWRGGPGGAVAEWDGCRSYPAGPATQMPAMNGVVQVQRRQMSYNAAAAAAAAAGATGYTSIKQEYGRAIPPKYVVSLTGLRSRRSPQRERLHASGLSICSSVVCRQIAKKAIFSKTKQFIAMVSIHDL